MTAKSIFQNKITCLEKNIKSVHNNQHKKITRNNKIIFPRHKYGIKTDNNQRFNLKNYQINSKDIKTSNNKQIKTLISFDIDGTLLEGINRSGSKLHADAFSASFKEAFDIDTTIDVIKHQGSTDPLIILKILNYYGIPEDKAKAKLDECMEIMINYFEKNKKDAGEGIRVLPGVKDLLKYLKKRGDVATCLVTGNLEPIGWGKMKAMDLFDFFTPFPFGGFGSDYCSGNFDESWKDRSELIKIAFKKALKIKNSDIRDRYHIGDAPMDMMAAKAAGATAIGVTTGIYSQDLLLESGSDYILNGLDDVSKVLNAINLC